jgi:hypothetical protein
VGKKNDKTLCKWTEGSYLKDPRAYKDLVDRARYACEKCGRVAGDKKWLCHPTKLQ